MRRWVVIFALLALTASAVTLAQQGPWQFTSGGRAGSACTASSVVH